MAENSSSVETLEPNPSQSESNPTQSEPNNQISVPQPTGSDQSIPATVNPTPNNPPLITPPPPVLPYAAPQFTPVPNPHAPSYHIPSGVQPMSGMVTYQVPPGHPPNAPMGMYTSMPNGYPPPPPPQGSMPYPGAPRYPSPYMSMVRPVFPLRPPGAIGVFPGVPRPPGVRPMVPLVFRPLVPITPAEKPQTTVYVGKIASTVENDFMLSLLRLCGPVKSWKRAQDPSDGTPKGFGFCEFESAEGVLRALRLLSKFNVDGQELVLNVNQATREYLERYVEKKTENSKKLKETEIKDDEKQEQITTTPEKDEPLKSSGEDLKKEDNESGDKESQDAGKLGVVTDEDRHADQETLEKLTGMIEERLKTKPLPPPPAPITTDGSRGSTELPIKSKDQDSNLDPVRNREDRNDEDTTSENKPTSEHDRPETGSPERSKRHDRNRDRDKERDIKREKDREFDRVEREAQRERYEKERDRERKIQDEERKYKEALKEWESREREKERLRQSEKEREKEKERKRRKEIMDDESDDDDMRTRVHRSVLEEKRKRRAREKKIDMEDQLKEEKEVAEAQMRAIEEEQRQREKDILKVLAGHETNKSNQSAVAEESTVEAKYVGDEQTSEGDSGAGNHIGNGILQNGNSEETTTASSDIQQNSSGPARKLGFGLVASGKRTAVPSVFTEEEDDAHNDKKMRPLVPIDYSTEEMQGVQPTNVGPAPSNLAAAAEFAKRISKTNPREEKPDAERERSRRAHDRSRQRDRDWNDEDARRTRDENTEKFSDRHRDLEQGSEKLKRDKKLLDAKQLIDMIPKTKEELFSYEINWSVYDTYNLHERMRPWISKKITEFLGEEGEEGTEGAEDPRATLVEFIVSSTRDHIQAAQMLESLQKVLDEEAEMFVLKMWRMLIFEIKKVETGLPTKPKT